MLFPNEKIIYEIPIYSMPEKEFKKRWDKWKQDWYDRSEYMGHTPEQIEETVFKFLDFIYDCLLYKCRLKRLCFFVVYISL